MKRHQWQSKTIILDLISLQQIKSLEIGILNYKQQREIIGGLKFKQFEVGFPLFCFGIKSKLFHFDFKETCFMRFKLVSRAWPKLFIFYW